METKNGTKLLAFVGAAIIGLFIWAAAVGSSTGSRIYTAVKTTFPVEPPAASLELPDRAYNGTSASEDWSAWAALTSSVIGALTLLVLYRTLRNTEDLLSAAQTTNRIAEQTLLGTVQSAEAQVRAYLRYENPVLGLQPWGLSLKITISNMGHSPALRVGIREMSISLTAMEGDGGEVTISSGHDLLKQSIAAMQIFGQESKRLEFTANLHGDDIATWGSRMASEVLAFTVRGDFFYEDVFDKAIVEKFHLSGVLNRGLNEECILMIISRTIISPPPDRPI